MSQECGECGGNTVVRLERHPVKRNVQAARDGAETEEPTPAKMGTFRRRTRPSRAGGAARTPLALGYPVLAAEECREPGPGRWRAMAPNLSAAGSRGARDPARQSILAGMAAAGGQEWIEATVARFAAHLQVDGLHTALGYLNSRTRFRYTGAYRFAPPLLCSIEIFDRENPTLALCAEVEMKTTYCSIVGAERGPLAVDDADRDARIGTHPAREKFAAYCGVPLRGPGGQPFGTLCHYDPRPRIGSTDHILLLERVAPLVSAYSLARLS